MERHLSFLTCLLSLLLVAFCPDTARGEALNGSFFGIVRDTSQAVVVGAIVVASNVDTNYSKEAVTDSAISHPYVLIFEDSSRRDREGLGELEDDGRLGKVSLPARPTYLGLWNSR
jgi:hypothetical protein